VEARRTRVLGRATCAEERRFQQEGGEGFIAEERPLDRGGLLRQHAPVGAELKRHHIPVTTPSPNETAKTAFRRPASLQSGVLRERLALKSSRVDDRQIYRKTRAPVDAGAAEAKSTLRRHPDGIAQGTSHSEIRIRTDCSVCASLARPEALTSLAKVPRVLGWRASHCGAPEWRPGTHSRYKEGPTAGHRAARAGLRHRHRYGRVEVAPK
jgi:hypothetical protein